MPCGICKKPGHNRKTCTEASTTKKPYSVSARRPAVESDSDSESSTSDTSEENDPTTTASISTDLGDFLEFFSRLKIKGKRDSKTIQWNTKALERFHQGPSEKDRPGHIYILQDSDTKGPVKIGQSKNVKPRVSAQQRANCTQYQILHQIPTPWAYLTETMIHLQLDTYRDPKPEGDGRTEWFRMKPEQAILTVNQAVERVKRRGEVSK